MCYLKKNYEYCSSNQVLREIKHVQKHAHSNPNFPFRLELFFKPDGSHK